MVLLCVLKCRKKGFAYGFGAQVMVFVVVGTRNPFGFPPSLAVRTLVHGGLKHVILSSQNFASLMLLGTRSP